MFFTVYAIEWMTSHHLSSKNLTSGEKLALMDALKEEIALENEKRKNEGSKLGGNVKNGNVAPLQLEGNHKNRDTYTDNQVAKKAGVGVGAVARYDAVMKSDNEPKLYA